MMEYFDFIVVGSGCSGSMAAQTLVESGARVLMLDVGVTDQHYSKLVPDRGYIHIRSSDKNQYRYFLGDEAEGLAWNDIGKGAQITPPRRYITSLADKLIPLKSSTFSPMESLGYGGLGIGWGLQCWAYSNKDLQAAGLNVDAMNDAYNVIAERIGISGTKDDAAAYTLGPLKTYQPSPKMDRNHTLIQQKYHKHRNKLNKSGFVMGRTPLALITEAYKNRRKYPYHDMDFYTDAGESAWRPWQTINALKKKKNFTYCGGLLVTSFKEKKGSVTVNCLTVDGGIKKSYTARKLILAASSLGSARIVLRSFKDTKTKVPILCNPYTYIPCLQPAMAGKEVEPKKLGYAQLSLFLDEGSKHADVSVASLYSYQSLMLFRIIRQAPLDFINARILMRYLMSGLVIMGVHHPDMFSTKKYAQLRPKASSITGDELTVHYELSTAQKTEIKQREKKFTRTMRLFKTYPLKRINPGYGASVHYAGTLPFSEQNKPYTLDQSGKLQGTKSVYVADSSGFNFLPAQGLTFTLMANAHVTAEEALRGI